MVFECVGWWMVWVGSEVSRFEVRRMRWARWLGFRRRAGLGDLAGGEIAVQMGREVGDSEF
jgi:hypothetical protein